MSGEVSREEASVYYPAAEPIETSSSKTPALEDSGRRFSGHIRVLAAVV
jgi:hypothetical protein